MKRLLFLLLALALGLSLSACRERPNPYEGVPNPVATIVMKDGRQMRAELFIAEAPNTVGNFIELANNGFYDGMPFYRVVAGRLVQTGDPVGDGTGNPGYTIRGEFEDNGVKNGVEHTRGTLSMARREDKNSAGSQFFILQRSVPDYDGKYAAFGRLMDDESLATLGEVASVATDGEYSPLVPQVIESIRVDTFGYVFPVVKEYPHEGEERR